MAARGLLVRGVALLVTASIAAAACSTRESGGTASAAVAECEEFVRVQCAARAGCGVGTADCERSTSLRINCASAVRVSPSYQACLSELSGGACSPLQASQFVPDSCREVIVVSQRPLGAACGLVSDDACVDECIVERCCSQAQACNDSASCLPLNDCLGQCGDDTTCFDACAQRFPAGQEPLVALFDCLESSCQCAPSADGGGG